MASYSLKSLESFAIFPPSLTKRGDEPEVYESRYIDKFVDGPFTNESKCSICHRFIVLKSGSLGIRGAIVADEIQN